MELKKHIERKSNIELLRILAFLMVIFIHVTPTGLTIPNGIISHSFSWYYTTIMRGLCAPAVALFIMISGYVCYINKEKYSIKKNLKRIIIPLIFFIPLLFMINVLVNGFSIETIKQFLNMSLTLNGSFHHLWYIVGYIFVIIIAPMLMRGIDTYSKNEFTCLLLIMYILIGVTELVSILECTIIFRGMFSNNLIFFITMFLTGYYINKYDIKINKILLIIMIITTMGINYKIFLNGNPINAPLNFMTIANNFQLFNILHSIFIFLFFKELKMKNYKSVNYIAKLTYGAYIVHVFYIYYNQRFFPFLQYINKNNYFIYDIIFVISVAICSLLTESVRQFLVIIYRKIILRVNRTNK